MADPTPAPDLAGTFDANARVSLFGFDSTSAHAHLRPRSRGWRVRGVVRIVAITLVVVPMVGVIPPHAPWILGVLGGGTFFARRRWNERFTLVAVEGRCPRCGADLHVRSGRLRSPHSLSCDACHNDVVLEVPSEALHEHASETE